MASPIVVPGAAEEPGAGGGPKPDGEAAPAEPSRAEAEPLEPSVPEDPPGRGSGDYLARVRAEPEFAVDQVREKDRTIGRIGGEAAALRKRWESLDPMYERLGGAAGILDLLTQYNNLLGNKSMAETVNAYLQSGTLPGGTRDDSGRLEDEPDLDRFRGQIQNLESKVQDLTGRVGKHGLDRMFEKLQGEFRQDWTDLAPRLQEHLDRIGQNPAGREVLNAMDYDTLQTVALKLLYGSSEDRARRGERDYLRSLEAKRRAATDEPSRVPTSGRETPKAAASFGDAFRNFTQETGLPVRFGE